MQSRELMTKNKNVQEHNSDLFSDKVNKQRELIMYTQMKTLHINQQSKFKGGALEILYQDLDKVREILSNMSWIDRLFKLPPYDRLKQEIGVIEDKIRIWEKYEAIC